MRQNPELVNIGGAAALDCQNVVYVKRGGDRHEWGAALLDIGEERRVRDAVDFRLA